MFSNHATINAVNSSRLGLCITLIVPIVGVIFFDWNAFAVIFFYCIENFLLGFFFLTQGLIGVFYNKKLSGLGFLFFFSLIYFGHSFLLSGAVLSIGQQFSTLILPTYISIVMAFISLLIPNIFDLIKFMNMCRKNITKIDIKNQAPAINFVLNFKEIMLRLIIIWVTLMLIFILFLGSSYFGVSSVLASFAIITIFSGIRFFFNQHALKERAKIFDEYYASLK